MKLFKDTLSTTKNAAPALAFMAVIAKDHGGNEIFP